MKGCVILLVSLLCGVRALAMVASVRLAAKSSQQSAVNTGITSGVIVGGGRIGNFMHEANEKRDLLLAKRGEVIDPATTGPIYICTRNNDLDSIIANTPSHRLEDLVFLQNGVLTTYLKSKGLSSNTQGLIYFAVSKKGEKPIDGITDLNPDGLTAVTGKWANDFKSRMVKAGLTCHVLDKPEWEVAMLEKHIWICAFMAVGSKYSVTVGAVEKDHNAEVKELIDELGHAITLTHGIQFPHGLADRLCAYARSVAHFPTALKEFEWRNGYFTDVTFNAVSKLCPDPCPKHTEIMTSQNMLFSARKLWIQRGKEEAKLLEFKWGQTRALYEMRDERNRNKST